MATGEDPFASGADSSNLMVTGEEPFASRANGSNRMGTDEAHQSRRSSTRARIEVFSVVMREEEFEPRDYRDYRDFFGVIFLCSCNQDYNQDFVIFDAEALQLPQINSEGHVTLSGPRRSIPVEDSIDIFVWFFDRTFCTMHRTQIRLWEDKSDYMDGLISRSMGCLFRKYLYISFAVYHDAVEAHLNVYFVDFDYEGEDGLIQVHRTVCASNSFLTESNAKSILFHKLSKECVGLKPDKLVPLPLSRRVTSVPRQSSLLVHVSIEVGIEPDNLLVIEETVKFNPSLGSTKGSIIIPNRGRGKVVLMVSWVDCQTLDGDGPDHLMKEEDVASLVANFIDAQTGEGDPRPQRSSVMECIRDSKVPRVEYQTDVHTRFSPVEASQSVIVDQQQLPVSRFPPVEASQSVIVNQQQLPVSRYIKMPRNLMEVFSVKFLEFNQHDFDQMYGCIVMNLMYVVFSRKQGGLLNITPEGFVKLRGPNMAIEAYDNVLFVPHLFKYGTCSDQFKDYDKKVCWGDEEIWDDIRGVYDMFLSKRILSRFGPIEVDFAVYGDGVEARVEVSLTGCQFASAVLYGCITAENSKLGERARSFLFNRDKTEGIRLDVSPYKNNIMKLPLSRSITVHPIGSDVSIAVNIWQSSIMGSQDQPIAKNKTFKFTYSSVQAKQTFMGDACLVNVGVVWAKKSELPINIECPFI
ncbi:uncharacterized protein LOC144562068 isoform X2 [Carex rostrata]